MVGPDSTVAVRTVKVDTAQGPITIVAQGIQPGDRVVVDGQNQLRAGAKVDARPVLRRPGERAAQGSTPQAVEQPPPQPASPTAGGTAPPATPEHRRGAPPSRGEPREASVQ